MPINPTTLKALIDTQITNETVDFAITPNEVGSRMKDTIDYTTEQSALAELLTNKSTNVTTDGTSNIKYPSVKSVKDYADGLVVGLLDDRGNFDASDDIFPSTGGSGTAGAIMKGDLWFIDTEGTLGGNLVVVGSSIRALVDAPGQTSANWSILNVGLGYVPENVANKSTNPSLGTSDTLYPTQKAVKAYVDANSVELPYIESAFKVSQSGTNEVTRYNVFVDQLFIGPDNSNPLYRDFYSEYVSVGTYKVGWIWFTGSESQISGPKLDFNTNSGRIKIIAETNSSVGPYSLYTFTIETRNDIGVLANGVLGFTSFYFRLFN